MTEKEKNKTGGEVIQRYCPHIEQNVILLRISGDGEDSFCCLLAEHCKKRAFVTCLGSAPSDERI